ncbi:tetratricopeptide repeat protein, partial [Hydrogenimonas sp.]|uniref:tetratricopeptide repeat protein n=1 Tax=Hydrogenimonas sp. TaxID=2231112 RepID=UPI002612EA80
MYESFVYSGDLVNAQKSIELALRRYPENRKWLERAAKVALWRGESEAAIRYLKKLYRMTKDAKYRDRLIRYALEDYQYEAALPLVLERYRQTHQEKDLETLSFLYEQVGEPEKARDLLIDAWKAHPDDRQRLLDALQISLNMGDVATAGKIVEKLEKVGIETSRGAELLSYYYLITRRPVRAYDVLITLRHAHPDAEIDSVAYDRKISDLGWLVGRYDTAAEASLRLIRMDKANEEDYDRVILEYGKKNPKVAFESAKKALKRFGTKRYFYIAAYLTLVMHDDRELGVLLEDAKRLPFGMELLREPTYHLILAGYLQRMGSVEKALVHLKKAYSLDPENLETIAQLLWAYHDMQRDRELEKLLHDIEKKGEPSRELLPAIVAAHMQLQQSDRARFYMKKMEKFQKNKGKEEAASEAYLFQLQGRLELYKRQIVRLYYSLSKEAAADPSLWRDDHFLDMWLRTAMEVLNADRFETELEKARPYLTKREYEDIETLWLLRNRAYEEADIHIREMVRVEPWMVLSVALGNNDLTLMQKTLHRYSTILPIRDRVDAARLTGSIPLAQTLAFIGSEENERDYLLYYQREQLMRAESDRFRFDNRYQIRKTLDRYRMDFKNRNKLPNSWILRERFQIASNRNPSGNLQNVPDSQQGADLLLTKRFDRGSV